jgi:hypothetical protein
VKCERREGEIVPAEAKQRNADDRGDRRRHDGGDDDRQQGVDAGVGIEEPVVGVEPNGQERGGVGADQEEGALPEGDLAGEAHEQRETDRDERVEAHPVVETELALRELEGQPTGEDRRPGD